MKKATTFLQLLTLSACLAVQFSTSDEIRMPGMRRALETISVSAKQATLPNTAPVAAGPSA